MSEIRAGWPTLGHSTYNGIFSCTVYHYLFYFMGLFVIKLTSYSLAEKEKRLVRILGLFINFMNTDSLRYRPDLQPCFDRPRSLDFSCKLMCMHEFEVKNMYCFTHEIPFQKLFLIHNYIVFLNGDLRLSKLYNMCINPHYYVLWNRGKARYIHIKEKKKKKTKFCLYTNPEIFLKRFTVFAKNGNLTCSVCVLFTS